MEIKSDEEVEKGERSRISGRKTWQPFLYAPRPRAKWADLWTCTEKISGVYTITRCSARGNHGKTKLTDPSESQFLPRWTVYFLRSYLRAEIPFVVGRIDTALDFLDQFLDVSESTSF